MRHICICASILAALSVFGGCSKEPTVSEGNGLRVNISCGSQTKATKDGVGNENYIKTIDCFLFGSGHDTYNYRVPRISPGVNSNYTFYVESSFIENNTYTVFVIVNYPGDPSDLGVEGTSTEDSDKRTLAALKALTLNEANDHTFMTASKTVATDDLALVMTGSTDVTVNATAGQAILGTANVELERVAAKVTMDFYIKDQVTRTIGDVTETWEPMTDGNNVRVYLCDANGSVLLDGSEASGGYSLFDFTPSTDITQIPGKTDYSSAFSSPAFYSYPQEWNYGDLHEPFLKLIVPWKVRRSTGGSFTSSQREFYYKVMLPTKKLESNTWYNLILDVTQLGSDSDNDAVNILASYQVAPWGDDNIMFSSLVQSYYLNVGEENKNLDFYSETVDIPYTSSGEVEISSVAITTHDYFNSNTISYDNSTVNWVTLHNGYVTIDHPLNTDFAGTDYDMTRYIFTITLHLKATGTDTSYDQTIVATQYPPLFVTTTGGTVTSPTVYVNGRTSTSGNTSVYDDSATALNSSTIDNFLGSVAEASSAMSGTSNVNPNLYKVTATILDMTIDIDSETKEVVLGDPRSSSTESFSGNLGVSKYFPSDEDKKNVVSPKFMIASSYGKTFSVSYEGARKRCASYQEYGYPAGRWRLPTMAEIKFLVKLSADEKIPSLFNTTSNNSGYWAAGEHMYIGSTNSFMNTNGVSPTVANSSVTYSVSDTPYSGYVRCVYDTWYWGEDPYGATTGTWHGFQDTRFNDGTTI